MESPEQLTLELRKNIDEFFEYLIAQYGSDLKTFKTIVGQTGLFDPGWYLAENLDVAVGGEDPFQHFAEHGFREARPAGPLVKSPAVLSLVKIFEAGLLAASVDAPKRAAEPETSQAGEPGPSPDITGNPTLATADGGDIERPASLRFEADIFEQVGRSVIALSQASNKPDREPPKPLDRAFDAIRAKLSELEAMFSQD